MSVGNIEANAIAQFDKQEREERKLFLRIILWLVTGNYKLKIEESSDEVISNLGDSLAGHNIEIEDVDAIDSNTDIVNRQITLLENNKNIEFDILTITNIIRGYKSLYKSIRVCIVLLSNNFESPYSYYFLSKLSEKEVFSDPIIDPKSTITASANVFLDLNAPSKSNQQWAPGNIDAKMAAIFSHYVYFYLDWLELSEFYKKGNPFVFDNSWDLTIDVQSANNQKSECITKKRTIHIYEESSNKNKKQPTNLFSRNREDGAKTKLRVINRLLEIANVCDITDLQKQKEVISEVLNYCSVINRPMEFYDLYNKFGYWDTIKDMSDTDDSKESINIVDEAKSWHVSHPGIIYERDSGEKWSILKKKHVFIACAQKGMALYYNTVLKSGMGKIDGYGGLLFVKTVKKDDSECPVKFAYVTKGTDVNSINDWIYVDVLQGLTGFSLQHVHTINNAKSLDNAIRRQFGEIPFFFAGHSLGGGLASSNAIASKGRHAITFNAAGLNFIGSVSTRLFSALTLNVEALNPSGVTQRVHPIRIKGEAIDQLMKLSKLVLFGLNERGYGDNALILNLRDGILSPADMAAKHGINNFLFKSILTRVRIVEETTTDSAYVDKSQHKVLFFIKMKGVRIKDIGTADIVFESHVGEKFVMVRKYLKSISNTFSMKTDE